MGSAPTDPGEPATSGAEAGLRLTAELQLSYATGVVAGTVTAAYSVLGYGRETGYPSLSVAYFAAFLAVLLELASVGMILHVMYRGFWMAMRLLVETRTDQGLATPDLVRTWEQEILELDGACQALFFRTFRVVYAGMIWALVSVAFLLVRTETAAGEVLGGLLLLLVLPSLVPPVPFFSRIPLIGPVVAAAGRGLTRAQRTAGLWWLSVDPKPLSRLQWTLLGLGAVVLFGANIGLMFSGRLSVEKSVYFQSETERVVLTYRHGGVCVDRSAVPDIKARCDALRSGQLRFQRVSNNTYIAVAAARDFAPGPVEVSLSFRVAYRGESGQFSFNDTAATTEFLVSP